jgi:hypothetical protein
MSRELVQKNYLSLLKLGKFSDARKYLVDFFNEADIKSDIRRTDWIHLCDLEDFDRILIFGDSYGELAFYFSSIFKHVDIIVSDNLDSKIIKSLATFKTNITLLDCAAADHQYKYEVVYVNPSFKINGPLTSFYKEVSSMIQVEGILVKMNLRKLWHWSSESKTIENAGYSIEKRYGWLPIHDQSPLFVFDISNKFVMMNFLQNMINIFSSVSPEYVKKYMFKIMALKLVKQFFVLKLVRRLFPKILPSTLLICKYDQNH